MYQCGLLTVSDSCFYLQKENLSGKYLQNELNLLKNFHVSVSEIVPDEINLIEEQLIKFVDKFNLKLIITTGGTGFCLRDVTPEATIKVIEKQSSSISQFLLMKSLEKTEFAALSRGISGIRKSSLIINFPGSLKAVKECLSFLVPVLPHAIDQLSNLFDEVKQVHSILQAKKTTISVTANDVADRSRNSNFPLFSIEKAQMIVFNKSEIFKSTKVNVIESLNMITSEIVKSHVSVPPYRSSIKDGYAVKFSDKAGQREVISVVNAGDETLQNIIKNGTCARISTGAKVPDGADAVVQVEDTELLLKDAESGEEKIVEIKIAPTEIGQDIRPIGNDLKEGDIVIDKGILIGPCEIGILAMAGISEVECIRKPKVGILSTGNELISHTNQERKDLIFDCNRPFLISLLKLNNFETVDLGIMEDDPQSLLDILLSAFNTCDVIITSGAVSMGEKDYLKSVLLQDLNAEIHFGRVFMKPGKPITFSSVCNQYTEEKLKLIFSLPGNPVSVFVTSQLFVIPALKKMAGYHEYFPRTIQALLMHDIKLDSRPEYRRCSIISKSQLNGLVLYEVSCEKFGNQMSSRLVSCLGADGLICLPPSNENCQVFVKGTTVDVLQL